MDLDARLAVISVLRRGLLSVAEVAQRSGLSRQTVYRYAREADIDLERVRATRADIEWRRALRNSAGAVTPQGKREED